MFRRSSSFSARSSKKDTAVGVSVIAGFVVERGGGGEVSVLRLENNCREPKRSRLFYKIRYLGLGTYARPEELYPRRSGDLILH